MCKPNLTRVVTVYLFLFSFAISGALYGSTEAQVAIKPTTEIASDKHAEILYTLLVAEFAIRNQEKELGLANYLKAAKLSGDPEVAELATHMAIELEAPLPALEGAELWASLAPRNFQAQLVAMTLFLSQSPEKAIQYIKQALLISPEEFEQYIIEIQGHLSEASAIRLNALLLRVAEEQPRSAYAQLSAAESAVEMNHISEANRLVEKTLLLAPNLTPAIQLKARLIRHGDKNDVKALQFLAEKVREFKENNALRLFYASALIDANQLDAAKEHLLLIKEDKKIGGQALLLLGETYFKQKKFNESLVFLQKATDYKENRDTAYYLLGQVEESLGNNKKAIKWYKDVELGNYQVLAALRAVSLLKTEKSYEEAIHLLHKVSPNTFAEQKQLLISEIELLSENNQLGEAQELVDEVLSKVPNDTDILYSHGLISIKGKNWKQAETDFRKIIKQNPKDANALNALGYTLSHNSTNLEEAKKYLADALALAPNNPYFIDSMGWLLYRMGDTQKALPYLIKAHELNHEDDEIAAHLGEALWKLNQKEEAKKVFYNVISRKSDHPYILETLKRLNIEIQK